MFKPKKKLNENAIKKDFFKVKKEIPLSEKIHIVSEIKNTVLLETNDLHNIELPQLSQTIFIVTKNARSLTNFILDINPVECYLFCSRLNKKSFDLIRNKNLKGIGLSERVLQNSPEFYNEVKKSTIVKLSNNHSKMLIFSLGDNYYVVSGSGNASINSRIENYIIENDKEKYNEIKSFFENA